MMRFHGFGAAFAAAWLCSSAQAEDCKPLTSYGTIPLTEIEGEASEFVPVEIAGTKKLMMLDTGAWYTTMSRATADELHLDAHSVNARVVDVTGGGTSRAVTATLKIGNIQIPDTEFMLNTAAFDLNNPRVAGLLGGNIYQAFDVSIDFGAHTLALLSQDHCEGKVVYWPERPVAMVPIEIQSGDEIVLHVVLDGQDVKAILDTGAEQSALDEAAAKTLFGIQPGSADTPATGNLNDQKGLTMWTHHFKSLSLAGIAVTNPQVDIIPDNRKVSLTGSSLSWQVSNINEPMLLGMNVLRHLHLYIAYKEKKLYITPASNVPAASASPAPAAPSPPPAQ